MEASLWVMIINHLGVAFAAITGALVAIEYEVDIVGMLTLSVVSGLGGGIIRDIFLGDLPPATIKDYYYIITCIVACISTFFYYRTIRKLEIVIVIADALSLGFFLVLGMEKAVSYHMNTLAIIIMGLFTCSFGGVIRDVLVNRVPYIFRREIYILNAIVGALLFVILKGYLNTWLIDSIVTLTVIVLRFITYFKKWQLPIAKEYKF